MSSAFPIFPQIYNSGSESPDVNFLLRVQAAATDRRPERETDTDLGWRGTNKARRSTGPSAAPRGCGPPRGLSWLRRRTVGTAGAEGTGPPRDRPPKGQAPWTVSEETRQLRPGHGVS